ncbi:MAG TPA: portal protein, partial [Candidatus Paceibacterota bacterium]
PNSADQENFIATAQKRFDACAADEKQLREEALTDLKYVAGDQWDAKLKQDRINAGRPALTFPRCHTFVQQVSNEARQTKPQIKFAPDDDSADKDTAEVYEGMARHIQYESTAQIAYETAVEYSAGGSFGYYRLLTEYCDDDSDEQELKILPVLDPFTVFGILVPYCFNREPAYGFVVEDIPRDEFAELYPKSPLVTSNFSQEWGMQSGWIGTETCRVAEYWRRIAESKELNKSGSRRKTIYAVKFCKITAAEKLEDTETDWPGYCIPIIPVTGKTMIVSGKPQIFSVVRYQRGAQQMINYAKTRIAETLATAPISPFLVARGQIAKGDKKWESLNTQNFPYLEYDSVDAGGRPAPPPQRQTFEPPIAALSSFTAQEIDDMKATTGIFDASLGQKSNETSGQAIIRRQQQTSLTTMHFMDNLGRSFQKGGDIMADVIPKIYDTERMVRILGNDEAPKIVKINAPYDVDGVPKHHKIGGEEAGKYRVIVTMGRAFSTKRMETFDMMQQLTQSAPNLLPMFGDIMFKNSDVAGGDIVAERFRKMLPPNLQEDDKQGDPEAKIQALTAQLMQSDQQRQALNAYAQQLEKEKEGKVIENQAKVQIEAQKADIQLVIEKAKLETQLAIAEITTKAQNERERLKLEADLNAKLHVSAHEVGMQSQQQAHESSMADKQADIQAMQAEQTHQQTLEQQQNQAELAPKPSPE